VPPLEAGGEDDTVDLFDVGPIYRPGFDDALRAASSTTGSGSSIGGSTPRRSSSSQAA
jgi:hypothetical protein